MPSAINITPGISFGMWTVLSYVGPSKWGNRLYHCACDCGREGIVAATELRKGNSQSCGCTMRFKRDDVKTHGRSHTKLYKVWSAMKHRCSKSNDPYYYNYGGRGIIVCDEWQSFAPFYEWAMANGYRDGLTIERKDNDKGYSPDNCTWIPKSDQSNNTRRCKMITFRGETHNIKDWALKIGVPYHRLQSRLKHGWEIEKAFMSPLIPHSLCHCNSDEAQMIRAVQEATGIETEAA